MDGIIVIDKPEGWTSHDVVDKIRSIAQTRKVGHLGTLDPIATGVLPLVLNRATRLAQFYVSSEKEYDARLRFGFSTDTYDREGTATSIITDPAITRDAVEAHLKAFRGEYLLTPPPVSAKKVGGIPAYRLARRQMDVTLKPVPVNVQQLELLTLSGSEARLHVHCSAGTYIRSIAHELGRAMGCGAHITALRRLRSGDFSIDQAHTIDELEALAANQRLAEAVIPASALLPEFPAVVIDPTTAGMIRQGRDFPVSPFRSQPGTTFVKAVSTEGELVAIGQAKLPHVYHPVVVL